MFAAEYQQRERFKLNDLGDGAGLSLLPVGARERDLRDRDEKRRDREVMELAPPDEVVIEVGFFVDAVLLDGMVPKAV